MDHPTLVELLEVRDGEGTGAVVRHVDGCAACRHEVERLRRTAEALRGLPGPVPPRDLWPELAAELDGARRRRWWRATAAALAVAASLAVATVVGVRRPTPAPPAPDITTLVAESQRLEGVFRSLDVDDRVMSASRAAALSALEDRISVVDAELAGADDPQRVEALWRVRVHLLNTMVGVSTTTTSYVGL